MAHAFSWTQKAGDALSTILDRLWLPDWTAGILKRGERPTFEAAAGRAAFYVVRAGTWRLVLNQSTQALLLHADDAAVLPHGSAHSLTPVLDRTTGDDLASLQ